MRAVDARLVPLSLVPRQVLYYYYTKNEQGPTFNHVATVFNPLRMRLAIRRMPPASRGARIRAYVRIRRVSNRKSESIQNIFISACSSRSTLGKIKIMLHIGEPLEKVGENAILNHIIRENQKWLRDQNYAHSGGSTS